MRSNGSCKSRFGVAFQKVAALVLSTYNETGWREASILEYLRIDLIANLCKIKNTKEDATDIDVFAFKGTRHEQDILYPFMERMSTF